jgi:hypothetical protein
MPSPPPGCSRPETRSGASSPGTAEDADARSGALGGRTVAAVGPLPPSPRGTRLAGERAGSVPAPEEEMRALMAEVDVRVAPASRGSTLALANLSGHPAIAVPNGFVDEDSPPQHHLRGAPPGRGGPPRRGLRVPGGHRLPPEAPAAVRPVRWNGAAHPRGSRPGAAPRDRGRPGSAARARPGGRGRAHRWAGRGAGWPGAWAAPAGPGRCMACRPGSIGTGGRVGGGWEGATMMHPRSPGWCGGSGAGVVWRRPAPSCPASVQWIRRRRLSSRVAAGSAALQAVKSAGVRRGADWCRIHVTPWGSADRCRIHVTPWGSAGPRGSRGPRRADRRGSREGIRAALAARSPSSAPHKNRTNLPLLSTRRSTA